MGRVIRNRLQDGIGTALKLPMTEATLIENAIMIVMAVVMLERICMLRSLVRTGLMKMSDLEFAFAKAETLSFS